jgi:Ca2+/H+ antiporter
MNEFSPVSLFYMALATLQQWFWPIVIVTLLLVLGVAFSLRSLRRNKRSAARPVLAGVAAGLVVTAAGALLFPYALHGDVSAFRHAIDFITALGLALMLGMAVFAAVFTVVAWRCRKA